MKNMFNIKCYGQNGNIVDNIIVNGCYSDISSMVNDINDMLSEYHKSDDDIIGHPLERTLRDIRGVSQHRYFVETLEQYPRFQHKVLSTYTKMELSSLDVLYL